MEAARSAQAQPGNAARLQLRSEQTNPVFLALDEQVAKGHAGLAAMERQRAQMLTRHLDADRMGLLTKLYEKEGELSRLEMERDLSRKVYLAVATSFETARLTVAGRSSALQIVGVAVPSDQPLPRGALRGAAVAFMAGLILAAIGTVLHHALSVLSRRAAA